VEKNVRFILVGTGHMLPELINQSIQMGISDNVSFAGYVDSIKEYYRMADLYVMPSVSEPFGIVALEAMASGLPVIVSKQSGVSEIAANSMKVDFWDVDEMSNKILGILRYDVLRKEMHNNGLAEVGHINWANTAEKTMAAYSRLAGG
jgi:glycosyltransferase involved in cell wall biosynthesis